MSKNELGYLKRLIRNQNDNTESDNAYIGLIQVAEIAAFPIGLTAESLGRNFLNITITVYLEIPSFMSLQDIIIKKSAQVSYIPFVEFRAATGQCRIEGECYMENPRFFFNDLIRWIDEYFSEGKLVLQLDCKFEYINSTSSKGIIRLMKTLKKYQDKGKRISVIWHYPEPDFDEIKMEGEDYAGESELDFNFVAYEDKISH